MKLIPAIRRYGTSLTIVMVLSCDSFKEDFIEPGNRVIFSQTEFFILPGTSTVINLKSIIKQSFTSASLTISNNPVKGILTQMDSFLLKYTPNSVYVGGRDEFSLSAVLDNGTTVKSQKMTISMMESRDDFSCGIYAVEDRVLVRASAAVVMTPLNNDQICGVKGSINISIQLEPKFGDVVVAGDSLIYTPDPTFSGTDELIYKVFADDIEESSYGIISLARGTTEVSTIIHGMTDVYFVDDTTGFIAGGNAIYKTDDGGSSWTLTGLGEEYFIFEEIHFLNKSTGFGAFSRCVPLDNCDGGWMMTTNGGSNWKRINFGYPVGSIFFTSSLTGFITTREDLSAIEFSHSIQKTIDGGKTWDKVFTTTSEFKELKVRFVNNEIGYAYLPDRIFATSDGGKMWHQSATNDYVVSLAIASENVACAVFNSDDVGHSASAPSVMVRYEGGTTWTTTKEFPYTIMQQGYSPHGGLGVVVGMSAPSLTVYPSVYTFTVSTTTDLGKTWVDHYTELIGFPLSVSVPSANTAFILCFDKLIKYSH